MMTSLCFNDDGKILGEGSTEGKVSIFRIFQPVAHVA